MRKTLNRLVRYGLNKTGLIAIFYRALERKIAEGPTEPVDDGQPFPPPDLLVLVTGTPSQRWFSQSGQRDAERFTALARAHGLDPASGKDVLDFGVGCGRIARWMAPRVTDGGGRFQGSDLNPRLAGWCAAHLPGRYGRNGLRPPLRQESRSLDLVYAYSVLTHLREPAARAWLQELARVLRPGGLALLSFHDESYARTWGPAGTAEQLAARPYVVLNDSLEGSNYLSSWTTRAHFEAMAAPWFDLKEIAPAGEVEQAHAIAVLRARAPT